MFSYSHIRQLSRVHTSPLHKARFVFRALRAHSSTLALVSADEGSLLKRTIDQRPASLDILESPYLAASWTVSERVGNFIEHIGETSRLGSLGDFDPGLSIALLDLEYVTPGLRVVLDKPAWMRREGTLSLSLFREKTRLYSVSFACSGQDIRTVIIGGIQGRSLPGITAVYHGLTKAAHGLRPRDLLVEILRGFSQQIRAERILAISDEERHHRAKYFSGKDYLSTNYNEIWAERGGWRRDRVFFELPVIMQRREVTAIPSRKRALYRKRYDLLDRIYADLGRACTSAVPVVGGPED